MYRKPWFIKQYSRLYCSNECKYSDMKTGKYLLCSNCDIKVWRTDASINRSISGNIFCTRSCATIFRNKRNVGVLNSGWKGGISSYRNIAFRERKAECANVSCPVTKAGIYLPKALLDVDHIDNNRKNCDIENLQILCVYCHSAKTRKVKLQGVVK